MICILCTLHYVGGLSNAFFVFTFKICLRHQSVMPFLSGASPPKKNPGSHAQAWYVLLHVTLQTVHTYKKWEMYQSLINAIKQKEKQ